MDIYSVIFDLNGTVLSDEYEYGLAFRRVLESLGASKIKTNYPHEGGIGVEENWPKLLAKYNIKTDKSIEELSVATQSEYFKIFDRVELRDGFEEFCERLKSKNIYIGLATSNTWSVVELVFDRFNIENYFDAVTTAEEVSVKKPDPELFIITSGKLNTDSENCLVFEDSASGIEAAMSAGMAAVGVYRDEVQKSDLNKAFKLIKDFNDPGLDDLFSNGDMKLLTNKPVSL